MSAPRPTILDVARAAGVSSATVSRVINGAPSVDKELTRRVRTAVNRTGYVPNAAGRSLRRKDPSQIALVTPDAENPYFMHVANEVEAIARRAGYTVMLCHTEGELERENEYFSLLVSRQISGIIIAIADESGSDLSVIIEAGIPTVLVDRRPRTSHSDFVATDNFDAGQQAANHLWEQGFREPVCITGPSTLTTTENRYLGFAQAWAQHGIALESAATYRGDLHLESGTAAMQSILASGYGDCVYVTNNRMSAGAFEAIRSKPDSPALLATDDDLWARLVSPSISVVEQPIKATGRLAARMLAERMAEPNEPPRSTLLRSRIIQRESTTRRALTSKA